MTAGAVRGHVSILDTACRAHEPEIERFGSSAIGGELASLLGGAVGAARPPLDEEWAEEYQMIGQSGTIQRLVIPEHTE